MHNASQRDIWHVDYGRKRLEQAAQGWWSIMVVFGVNSVGFCVAWCLFLASRSSRSSLYWMGTTDTTATTYRAHFGAHATPFERFKAFYHKFRDIQSLHIEVGDEAAFYLTFQVYALRLVLAMSGFAFFVLVPVYVFAASTPWSAFSTLTIRSLPDKSPLLWVPVITTYIFSLFYGIFLHKLGRLCNNRDPAKTNLLCMIPSSLSARSILVSSGVPKRMAQDRILYLLDQIFPGYMSHVTVVYDLGPYRRLHTQRIAAEDRIERLQLLLRMQLTNSVPWMLRLLPGSLRFPEPTCLQAPLEDQVASLQASIAESKRLEARTLASIIAKNAGTGRIFLIFNDPKWKARFVKKTKYKSITHILARAPKKYHNTLKRKIDELQLTQWTLDAAPEPDDIDWECVSYQSTKRTLLTATIYTFLTVFIILFTSPLAVTSAISSGAYSTTAKWVNDIVFEVQDCVAGLSPVVAKMTFSYIPTMILVMLNAVLLNVVYHAGRMQPMSTDSAKEKSILHYSAVCTFTGLTLCFPGFHIVCIRFDFQYAVCAKLYVCLDQRALPVLSRQGPSPRPLRNALPQQLGCLLCQLRHSAGVCGHGRRHAAHFRGRRVCVALVPRRDTKRARVRGRRVEVLYGHAVGSANQCARRHCRLQHGRARDLAVWRVLLFHAAPRRQVFSFVRPTAHQGQWCDRQDEHPRKHVPAHDLPVCDGRLLPRPRHTLPKHVHRRAPHAHVHSDPMALHWRQGAASACRRQGVCSRPDDAALADVWVG
ncbi:hypothetical protein SPRG_05059 [Saprolegnia parasitica CBS 223.65]|uniref:CSC1/OSCA1-like 7TM region domain-containing protein n=1 Tax=Saprolegnia parasitica (strain CBS 223.65) TaxID=695850 RepID=A0A067CIL0_SAPPC|nr:hypothetical protein SPRG_05059 [Saprolegnia parasitica CBS 223.65]KDO30348.1 hypothetical protein SPRG_05059 [Saprolegnia parasitica CBS 223.65]|eukprot:XP_012198958.1 hypothetical protein SPRG_05059 [Saprolegnia parasitica CBS 223.65]